MQLDSITPRPEKGRQCHEYRFSHIVSYRAKGRQVKEPKEFKVLAINLEKAEAKAKEALNLFYKELKESSNRAVAV